MNIRNLCWGTVGCAVADMADTKRRCVMYQCAVCKREGVKLYRYYGSFLRAGEIYCMHCAPPGHIQNQNLVPLCTDTDGSVWGYTSVPQDSIDRFNALPD